MLLLILSVCVGLSSAQIIQNGQCPEIEVQKDFEPEKFIGKWYATKGSGPLHNGHCSYIDIELGAKNQYTVLLSYVKKNTPNGLRGVAAIQKPASFKLSFESQSYDFNVLSTDYNNYAIIYSCENIGNSRREVSISYLARDVLTANAEMTNLVDDIIISNFAINPNELTVTSHSSAECFTVQSAVTTGQCKTDVAVQENLNFTKLEGEWRIISSYNVADQTGVCHKMRYIDRGTILGIVNSRVVNRDLENMSGTATFATSESNGKLELILGVRSPIPFWILETDYDSYALAYSCENLPNNQQRVSSWKLSRTKEINAQANQKINALLATVGLENTQFKNIYQSDDACFYYPFLLPEDEVILPGQCNQNIPTVTNFDMTKFTGEWRLISSYYNSHQSGTCNRVRYTSDGSSYSVRNSHVKNRQLLTVSGTATPVSNGKLQVTIGNNVQELWILDTDYDSYALVYNCENLANNQQKVYSWKLSRTNELTEQAKTNINDIINRVDPLHEPYYNEADQSDSACFYYENLEPNEPVILPGQCDETVRVVNSFDFNRFAGEWRLISSYYNERQSGTCNRAKYTVNGNSLNVVNSHVVNRELRSVSGTARFASETVNDAKLKVTIGSRSRDYWILSTDYDSYALAYSCENLANNRQKVDSWKLSRTNYLTNEAIQNINRVMSMVPVLRETYYNDADQSDDACFYLPPVDSSNPVVFRGQCDPNIQTVTNFDVTRYMGQWYDIESYPSRFQYGTCNSGYYTQRDNLIDIINTQVVNEKISIREGVGRFAESQDVAKLKFNFGSSTPRDYWVLATDYSSYAFAYSCVNIDSQNMQVGAWKLSRTKQLTATAEAEINSVIANITVLEARYFVTRNHSNTGCIFNNNIAPGEPVVLPGSCSTTVPSMTNVDISKFVGTWYEIQSYPISYWPGQCATQRFFTSGTNAMSFMSRSIKDYEFIEKTGTATRSDSSGRLTITLNTADGDVTIPFSILTTDYVDYALVYGCVKLNENLKRVYSWKLSRTRELSSAANTAINAQINAVADLDNSYYPTVDHSDKGCFYLPDIPEGQAVVVPGQCATDIPVVTGFNVERFLGRWRLMSSYYTHRQSGQCNQVQYTRDGDTIRVTNMHVINAELSSVSGTLTAPSDGTGKLTVNISVRSVDFWILATDYDSYALAYSCANINTNQRRIYSWKLSRTATLSREAETAINTVVDQIDVLNERYYKAADHSENACFYYPTVDPTVPVVFPGQCDQTIPVVLGFSLSRYLGVWYDVESYPSSFQYGTCNTARYSVMGNNLLVENSQVVNGNLSRREAVGVFPQGSNIGKIKLNFGSEDRDYWILSTDYTSYSLVYSCKNLDAFTKQVGTWKLSRTRELSSAAQNAIEVAMTNIRELDARYFVRRNHTEAGCFYHRDQDGNSVVFSGQCDTSIQAVPNFNFSLFQGVWHEIESYPSEMRYGECLSQEFTTLTSSSLNLVQRNVRFETLFEKTVMVTQISDDGSGKFAVTIPDSPGVTVPFWVLSTHYNDYVLAYGCVNINQNERQVYSWKLSRTKELSPSALAAIDVVESSVPVLDSRYYKPVNQSEDACFYLPKFKPDETVVLPGQCDLNIPVVQNFDAARYGGTWYQIEKYYQRFEGGNCTGARYTLNSDTGVVDVLNWQVINGQLDTIEGTATVTSNDGSAKLTVRLPIRSSGADNPQFREMSLYVLDTDYKTYSLAYSCINLNNYQRAIGAWKLSRTRTMPEAGNTAINAYMATRKELQSSYFVAVGQSDSCPEPSSASAAKSSLILILCASLVYLLW